MEEMVTLAKAMSDIHRVEIVALIQREGEVCVCELCDTLHLSQPLVSRHLRQLRQAGIVTARKEGKWTLYRIVDTPSKLLTACLHHLDKHTGTIGKLVACSRRTKE